MKMDFTPSYPRHSDSESTTAVYLSSSDYQLNSKANLSNMYSTQNFQSPNKKQLLGGSFEENRQNYSLGRMYSTKHSLSVENMDTKPKRETLWQSLTRSATNLLGKHLTSSTSSFLKNWPSVNNQLSVTVVSQDFYKSLQEGKNPNYPAKTWSKGTSHNSDEMLPNILYHNEIMSDCLKRRDSDPSDPEKEWNDYKRLYVNCEEVKEKNTNSDQQIVNSVNKSEVKSENLEPEVIVHDEKELDKSTNFANTMEVDDEPVMLEKPETQQETKSVKSILTNAYNKVMNGLQLRSTSPEQESATLFTKRACSPKIRIKKQQRNISSGRGRGRGRSQLRRSGVSQKRHRKEHIRHGMERDMKSDMDNWEELDYTGSSLDDDKVEDMDLDDFVHHPSTSFTIDDVIPKKTKLKQQESKEKSCEWIELGGSSDDDSVEDHSDDDNDSDDDYDYKCPIRSRLLSESSCDSEDSYCIVFEDEDEDDSDDCETDRDNADMESDSDDDEENFERNSKRVRFNPKPTVHMMIYWNFAYREARRNTYLSDKEHFNRRIRKANKMCTPIFDEKHRMRIWHERFENNSSVN